jgi:hypothetical protein
MVELSKTPTGRGLEDYFAALLQTTGHFVEKNVEDPNVLELDIVATNYEAAGPRTRVFEVKGTDARFGDVFKLLGRMTYLGLAAGGFITTTVPRERPIETFTKVCNQAGILFVVVPDLAQADTVFDAMGFGRADSLRHEIWRFSYWLERIYVQAIGDLRPNNHVARKAIDYYKLVNSGIFLTRDPVEKIAKLYYAYAEHPQLTREMANSIAGSEPAGGTLLTASLRDGSTTPLHATMYFEHRARLSILKAAVDYLLLGRRSTRVEFLGLPQTFHAGLSWLADQPDYWLYPLFWQNFLWGWGGILPDDRREDILAKIASACGLLPDRVGSALLAFDKLFPIPNGWQRRAGDTSYEFVLLTPFHFQGLGLFHQAESLSITDYRLFAPSGRYTATNLAARHNAAVRLMEEAVAAEATV